MEPQAYIYVLRIRCLGRLSVEQFVQLVDNCLDHLNNFEVRDPDVLIWNVESEGLADADEYDLDALALPVDKNLSEDENS